MNSGSQRTKVLWLFALLGLIVFFIFNKSPKQKPIAELNPVAESDPGFIEPEIQKNKPVEILAHSQIAENERSAQLPSPQSKTKDEPPADRFTLRKLNRSRPKTIAELLNHLTDYAEPELPAGRPADEGQVDYDGSVTSDYFGYYETTSGQLKQIEMKRFTAPNMAFLQTEISIEDEAGKKLIWDWSDGQGEIKVKNFKNDPYSLVILFPDKRVMYLKFVNATYLTGPAYSPRKWLGWILSNDTDRAKSTRVALVDAGAPEDEKEQPPQETIRRLFLPPLL